MRIFLMYIGVNMPVVKVKRQLNMTTEQVKNVADKIADKLQQEYGVQFAWSGDSAVISGSGLKGRCNVSEECIEIELNLGFLLTPFALRIEKAINNYFDKLA